MLRVRLHIWIQDESLQIFFDQFAAQAQDPAEAHVLLLDKGGAHHTKRLRWPEQVVPASCPELNPIERWGWELKDAIANTLFASLDALRVALDEQLTPSATTLAVLPPSSTTLICVALWRR